MTPLPHQHPPMRCTGRTRPARHVRSVDVFLEALTGTDPGDVLVIDNGGRLDEACIGDLVVLEAMGAGLGGMDGCGDPRDRAENGGCRMMAFVLDERRQRERADDVDRVLRLRLTLVLPQYRAY